MARQKNPFGTRQSALRAMDSMTHLTRAEMIDKLRKKFPDAAEAYLETLWATHRRESKENGSLIEVFYVRDLKDGKTVEPYLKSEWMFNPPAFACLTPQTAKIRYRIDLKVRIELSQSL